MKEKEHPTHDKGDIAQAAILFDLAKKKITTFLPTTQNTFADIVIFNDSKLESVQCKYVTPSEGKLKIPLYKRMSTTKVCRKTYSYNETSLDWIAVYNPDNGKVYYVPRAVWIVYGAQITLRLSPTKNNQQIGILMAEDFEDL